MGHFGFSYVGFVFMLMLIVPNLIWTKYQPKEYDFKDENRVLLVFERVGQFGVAGTALMFSDFNIRGCSLWSFWLIAAFVLMILYEYWWIRYFKSNRTCKEFYSSFYGIPVAGATLPVVAFFFLGLYGRVIWLIVSVIIFGIGHIGIHLQHRREMQS
jgi:hypothetical protein